MIRGKPLLANLIFIARIYQRPEHAVKLARRFHGPIAATVGNQLHARSWCQAKRQRIVVAIIDRQNVTNPFPFLSAPHTQGEGIQVSAGGNGVRKSRSGTDPSRDESGLMAICVDALSVVDTRLRLFPARARASLLCPYRWRIVWCLHFWCLVILDLRRCCFGAVYREETKLKSRSLTKRSGHSAHTGKAA